MKSNLISGIQPTGKLHLGNYLGALKNFVELQNSQKYNCYFFIADLHSLSESFEPQEKKKQILELAIDYLALGLDPKKSVIFLQSAVPAHSELAIILNNFAAFGDLTRMTQFKDKSKNQPQNINVGLFEYPVLMAADIFLYEAKLVPVGDDQLQHLELARELARKFNKKFGKIFEEPIPILTEVTRLKSLNNPSKKMSKSQPEGCLFLDDPPEIIKEKIMKAVTDSGQEIKYDEVQKPGISNLLMIYSSLTGEKIKKIEKKYLHKGYQEFKKDLASLVIKSFSSFRKKKLELRKKIDLVKKILQEGNEKANFVANRKIFQVKKKIGLVI